MSWIGYSFKGWPHNPAEVEAMLTELLDLYPDVQASGNWSRKSEVVSAAFHDGTICSQEMEILHEYLESGKVIGQKEWEKMLRMKENIEK